MADKINLVPVNFIKELNIVPDMFISTYALDESTKEAQLKVIEKGWLNVNRILLAYGSHSRFDVVEGVLKSSSDVSIRADPNLRSTIVAFR